MSREEFVAYLRQMSALSVPEKQQRFQQVMAGIQVSYDGRKRSGFIALASVIEDGVAVSREMQRRASSPQQTQGTK